MSTNEFFVHTPRQYRSYAYASKLPQSTSMSNIDHQTTPTAPSNRVPVSYNRRRTDTNFPSPAPLHSAPTVARSGITASVSTNDISQPTPRAHRHRLAEIQNTSPSRIPSPFTSKSPDPVRHVSTPVLPSQRKQKEDMQPKHVRLLGPISPTRNTHIPRSRTLGMLSSLTSSFSRSTLNIGSRHTSGSSSRSTEATTSMSTDNLATPVFTPSSRYIHTAQLNSYWCGRFQALKDRLHTEAMEFSIQNPEIMRRCTEEVLPNLQQTKPPSMGKRARDTIKVEENMEIEDVCNDYMNTSSDRRIQQVFAELQALCMTSEARKSLWEWQQAYARHEKNETLLPIGGKMENDRPGWVSRMGRAIIGSSDSTSSLGRRTGLSLGRNRRVSEK